MTASRFGIAWVVALVASACTDLESATNLNPEGPPMVRQVRLREQGNIFPVFAFGTHPQAVNSDYPALGPGMVSAEALETSGSPPKIRVIMDELLVGNYLEEIACRLQVDDDAYDSVPRTATPDDIARCSVGKDILPASCPGSDANSVCICKLDGGCDGGNIAKGAPVGVLDVNQDGAVDDTRFIPGAVGIRCGTIDVPLDLNLSYWNPSGDQNVPALGGFDALGPALMLRPNGALPAGLDCSLTFSTSVVDKQNENVCVPANGDITAGCTAGDTAAFKFKVHPLTIEEFGIADGDMGVSLTAPVNFRATAPVDMASLAAGVTVTTMAGAPVSGFTVTAVPPLSFRINWNGALQANTAYVLRITTSLTDGYKQPLAMPSTINFTTGS